MSYIFISYSKKNKNYADKLAKKLLDEGFDIWIDARIESGENWWNAIMKALRECDAFIVIMTPEAEDSAWVAREIAIADSLEKPVFPLLLKGSTNLVDSDRWSIYVVTQYENVLDGTLPSTAFYERLEKFVKRHHHQSGQELVAKDYLQKMPLAVTQLSSEVSDEELFPQMPDGNIIVTSHQLIILHGMKSGNIFKITKETISIGRDIENDLCFDYSDISRHHCRLIYKNNTYWIQDLGSTNGTFINGQPILKEERLKDRDYIRCGGYVTLRYRKPTRFQAK